jgi:hypothetical protein
MTGWMVPVSAGEFVNALVNISRKVTNDFRSFYNLRVGMKRHIMSARLTSKPRDFILAVAPQYGSYKTPSIASRMTFEELFMDCCRQIDYDSAYNLPIFVTFTAATVETLQQTSPNQLGDLAAVAPLRSKFVTSYCSLTGGPLGPFCTSRLSTQ